MRTCLSIFLLLLLTFGETIAQIDDTGDGATFDMTKKIKSPGRKGQFNFGLYHSLFHVEKWYVFESFKSTASLEGYQLYGTRSTGIGPIGLKGDYFVTNNIGLGFDFIYNKYNIHFIDLYEVYDPTYTYLITMQDKYVYTMERYRIQFRFNYHFSLLNPKWDLYLGAATGLNVRKIDFRENDIKQEDVIKYLQDSSIVFPISARICFGFHYYLLKNLGLNFELGIGGPILSTGLSFKF